MQKAKIARFSLKTGLFGRKLTPLDVSITIALAETTQFSSVIGV
jgi:hypothetical protein